MADFLLELFSEEIPAGMQVDAIEHLQTTLQKGLGVEESKVFSTPRRLAIIIQALPRVQDTVVSEVKGPKENAPAIALEGFIKKNNTTFEELEKRNGVYFATKIEYGRPTSELIKELVEEILANFPWPKSMRWGSGSTTWVRPLHSILCIFDGKIVPVEFAGIKAGNVTYGHRFLAPKAITINSVDDYEDKLLKAEVIANRDNRKTGIYSLIDNIRKNNNLIWKEDVGLLEEVVGLVEYPQILVGKIDDKFMDLPPEVLTMVMRSHQKYFALQNADNSLSPYFLITSNMKTDDNGKAIIAGNERVLRARFADARFFWDTDRKKPLSEWAEGLKTVTYHAKLGTVADKVERIKNLALELANYVPNTDKILVTRAAELCKADLVTGMVGEFAELQGIMGRYYANVQDENPAVADAISDHYKPMGASDSVPTAPVSICVALADKLDTLISMFAIAEKPTGSKDPFALRRAALGIIRIILENNLRIPLKTLFTPQQLRVAALHKAHEKLVKKTEEKLNNPDFAEHKIGKYLSVSETAYEDIPEDALEKLSTSLLDFFNDRLKVQLKDSGIRHDVINAVIADGDDDIWRIVARAKALQEFLQTEDSVNLLAAYKRASNIVTAEEKKDKVSYGGKKLDLASLEQPEEKTLLSLLEKLEMELNILKKQEKFTEAMGRLAELRQPLDSFFEKIMVNSEKKELRNARLCLLSSLRMIMDSIADFAQIEG